MVDLPPGYPFDTVWPSPAEEVRQEVVRFWLSEGALLEEARARERSKELIVVARTHSGQVASVSTACKVQVPQLVLSCF